MSGPALKKLDSHASIHEAALNEADELSALFSHLIREEEFDKARELAYVIVEHWESRTLKHAEAEEQGLYKEVVENRPELKDAVVALTRDHELLRLLVNEIKESLDKDQIDEQLVYQFYALIFVDQFHNDEEENVILEH